MIDLPSTNVSSSDDSTECENAGVNHTETKKNNKNPKTRELCSIFFPFVSEFMTFTLTNSCLHGIARCVHESFFLTTFKGTIG